MQTDLDPNEAVRLAVDWLVATPRDQIEGPTISTVMKRFGLSPQEACEAARGAFLRRARSL